MKTEAPMISFAQFLSDLGKSTTWGWRCRKRGWIRAINIAGRLYVTRESIQEFQARAEQGEFSKTSPLSRPQSRSENQSGDDAQN
jgi:hypothetical protein